MSTPTIELVDPATLLTDRNVRTHLHVDKALIGSIKENGVLVPITAVRDDDGNLRVRAGHRRTAAAVEAGLTEVPVVVIGTDADDDKTHAARIIGQVVENTHRTGMTTSDTVDAVAQLAAFGVSVASITRRTKLPKATVDAAAAVAGSQQARAVMDGHAELTLEQAAWVAEFDTDPDLQDRLVADLDRNPHLGAHVVQRLRGDRDDRAARAIVQARFPGLTWVTRPGWNDPGVKALDTLTDVAVTDWPTRGMPEAITETAHNGCPGHVAWLDPDYRGWTWDADDSDDDDAEAAEQVDPDDPLAAGEHRYRLTYGCNQPHRHVTRDYAQRDKANAAAQAAANGQDPDDARKAERRRLIALNKAGDAAAVVRRDWLTTFSQRKTAPKDAAGFVWQATAARAYPMSDLLSEGLPGLRAALDTEVGEVTAARSAHLHLCVVLWAHDAHVKRDSWRAPQDHQRRYLQALAGWGYPLSEVEQVITGDLTDQVAYDAITG